MPFTISIPGYPPPQFRELLTEAAAYTPPTYQPPHFTTPPKRSGAAAVKTKTPKTHTSHHAAATAHATRHTTRKTVIRAPRTPRILTPQGYYHQNTHAAESAAGLHKGSYDWYSNGAKGDRVGYNTGVTPPSTDQPVDYVTPGTVNDSNAFPNGEPAGGIPKAKWPTQTTGTEKTTFPYPNTKTVDGKTVLDGGNQTDQLLYGSDPSLAYAEMVDPALAYRKTAPAKYIPKVPKTKTTTTRTRTRTPKVPHPRTPPTGRTTTFKAFHLTPPAPVASRQVGHF